MIVALVISAKFFSHFSLSSVKRRDRSSMEPHHTANVLSTSSMSTVSDVGHPTISDDPDNFPWWQSLALFACGEENASQEKLAQIFDELPYYMRSNPESVLKQEFGGPLQQFCARCVQEWLQSPLEWEALAVEAWEFSTVHRPSLFPSDEELHQLDWFQTWVELALRTLDKLVQEGMLPAEDHSPAGKMARAACLTLMHDQLTDSRISHYVHETQLLEHLRLLITCDVRVSADAAQLLSRFVVHPIAAKRILFLGILEHVMNTCMDMMMRVVDQSRKQESADLDLLRGCTNRLLVLGHTCSHVADFAQTVAAHQAFLASLMRLMSFGDANVDDAQASFLQNALAVLFFVIKTGPVAISQLLTGDVLRALFASLESTSDLSSGRGRPILRSVCRCIDVIVEQGFLHQVSAAQQVQHCDWIHVIASVLLALTTSDDVVIAPRHSIASVNAVEKAVTTEDATVQSPSIPSLEPSMIAHEVPLLHVASDVTSAALETLAAHAPLKAEAAVEEWKTLSEVLKSLVVLMPDPVLRRRATQLNLVRWACRLTALLTTVYRSDTLARLVASDLLDFLASMAKYSDVADAFVEACFAVNFTSTAIKEFFIAVQCGEADLVVQTLRILARAASSSDGKLVIFSSDVDDDTSEPAGKRMLDGLLGSTGVLENSLIIQELCAFLVTIASHGEDAVDVLIRWIDIPKTMLSFWKAFPNCTDLRCAVANVVSVVATHEVVGRQLMVLDFGSSLLEELVALSHMNWSGVHNRESMVAVMGKCRALSSLHAALARVHAIGDSLVARGICDLLLGCFRGISTEYVALVQVEQHPDASDSDDNSLRQMFLIGAGYEILRVLVPVFHDRRHQISVTALEWTKSMIEWASKVFPDTKHDENVSDMEAVSLHVHATTLLQSVLYALSQWRPYLSNQGATVYLGIDRELVHWFVVARRAVEKSLSCPWPELSAYESANAFSWSTWVASMCDLSKDSMTLRDAILHSSLPKTMLHDLSGVGEHHVSVSISVDGKRHTLQVLRFIVAESLHDSFDEMVADRLESSIVRNIKTWWSGVKKDTSRDLLGKYGAIHVVVSILRGLVSDLGLSPSTDASPSASANGSLSLSVQKDSPILPLLSQTLCTLTALCAHECIGNIRMANEARALIDVFQCVLWAKRLIFDTVTANVVLKLDIGRVLVDAFVATWVLIDLPATRELADTLKLDLNTVCFDILRRVSQEVMSDLPEENYLEYLRVIASSCIGIAICMSHDESRVHDVFSVKFVTAVVVCLNRFAIVQHSHFTDDGLRTLLRLGLRFLADASSDSLGRMSLRPAGTYELLGDIRARYHATMHDVAKLCDSVKTVHE
jgi:hypothetical protein